MIFNCSQYSLVVWGEAGEEIIGSHWKMPIYLKVEFENNDIFLVLIIWENGNSIRDSFLQHFVEKPKFKYDT